jgi:hypothetical protein
MPQSLRFILSEFVLVKVVRTIKGGQVYDPAALEQAMGMSR